MTAPEATRLLLRPTRLERMALAVWHCSRRHGYAKVRDIMEDYGTTSVSTVLDALETLIASEWVDAAPVGSGQKYLPGSRFAGVLRDRRTGRERVLEALT